VCLRRRPCVALYYIKFMHALVGIIELVFVFSWRLRVSHTWRAGTWSMKGSGCPAAD